MEDTEFEPFQEWEGMIPMRCISVSEKLGAETGSSVWVYTFIPDPHQGHLAREHMLRDVQNYEDGLGADLPDDWVGMPPAISPVEKQWRVASSKKLDEFQLGEIYMPHLMPIPTLPDPPQDIRSALSQLFGGAQVITLSDLVDAAAGGQYSQEGVHADDGTSAE